MTKPLSRGYGLKCRSVHDADTLANIILTVLGSARERNVYVSDTNQWRSEMDNQHREIKGYRELDQAEIDRMNQVKEMGKLLGILVDGLKANPDLDQRWVSIGATQLQQGLMALTRAIAKPTFF
jgi:hypothetical protein